MSADEDPTRTLSPSERVTSATWLKAVASMDDGQQSLRDVLGVKALDEEPELPDDLEADVHGRARVYLKSLGLTYPELGRLLTSRYAGAALAAVARMCNALSNAIANHENLSKVRAHAHRVVVVLVSCKAPASATLPVSQNGRLQDLDKVSKALTKYVEFYTDVGFLRKHLTGAEFKETVGTYVVRAVSDLQDIAKADGKSDSAVAKIGSYSDLALIDTSKLDSIVARHRHERATLVQAVSQPSAVETMSGDAAPELLVRDRGSDAVVADAPKGHHYVVMFNHDGALQQVNITCRDLDDRWLFDMEPRTVSSEVVSVVGPAGKPFSLGSPLYDLLDHLLHAVEEIEHKYTSDKDFLEQAMQAE